MAVKVKLDKQRTLRYDLLAFKRIKQATGKNPMNPDDLGAIVSDPDGLTAMLWAGLMGEDEDLTQEAVAGMIELKDLPRIQQSVQEAFGFAQESALTDPPKGAKAAP